MLNSGVSNMQIPDDVIVNADVPGESTNDVRTVDAVPGENAVGVPSVDASSVKANVEVEVNNVSRADSVLQPDNLDAGARNSAVADGETYASRAARTAGSAGNAPQPWRRSIANDMPKRPRSALFTPSRFTSARSVFDALNSANVDTAEIQCLQRKMNDEVVVTFKSPAAKEKFLSLNSITINNERYAIQDIDRPLTFFKRVHA